MSLSDAAADDAEAVLVADAGGADAAPDVGQVARNMRKREGSYTLLPSATAVPNKRLALTDLTNQSGVLAAKVSPTVVAARRAGRSHAHTRRAHRRLAGR